MASLKTQKWWKELGVGSLVDAGVAAINKQRAVGGKLPPAEHAAARSLSAAVTAACLVASSDGDLSPEEYDALVDSLEDATGGALDRDWLDEIVTAAMDRLSGADPAGIARELKAQVSAAHAPAIYALALAIAASDGIAGDEAEAVRLVADALGIKPT